MRLCFFGNVADATPQHRDLTWEEFTGILQQPHVVKDKRSAPCFSPAAYPEGATRKANNVTHVSMAVLDIDAIDGATLETLCDKLEPFAYAAYTTPSHPEKSTRNPDQWALRIILPLTEPIAAARWPAFWQHLHTYTLQTADPQCKDPSRLYILPSHYPADPPPNLDVHPGRVFNPSDVLPHTPTPQNATHAILDPLAIGQRIDPSRIKERAKNLARRGTPESQALSENLRALLASKPYGAPGKRNRTMLSLTMELDRMFPGASPHDIAALFGPSHQAMEALDDDPPDPHHTLIKAIEGARSLRLERRQQIEQKAATSKQLRIAAARGDGESHPYTPDELEAIAAAHDIPPDHMQHQWILRHGAHAFFLGLRGYSDAHSTMHGVMPTAAELLAPATHIQLHEIRGKGADAKTVFRPFDAVVADYGRLINRVVYDLRAPFSRLDYKSNRLHIASAPQADLTPTEHPLINEWLTLLGGDRAEIFLRWIAAVPDMSKQLCAIYIHGAQGVGKTVFAHGLSKLWERGTPTPFAVAVSKFNYPLAQCPLIVVDEGFPNLPAKQLATELRTLTGGDEVQIEQKFGGSYPLLGPRRMILAANNTSLLDFKSELSHDDIRALAVRIIQITPDEGARDVFAKLTPHEFRAWQSHQIAEHVLWLSENLAVTQAPGSRFHVQGEVDETMRQVVVDGYYTSLACQVLVRYITSPQRKTERKQGLIRFGDGELLVNQEGLNDAWHEILSRGPQPPAKLGALLRALSSVKTSRCIKTSGMVKRFWPVDLNMLATWCDSNGYMAEEIRALIDAPVRAELLAMN